MLEERWYAESDGPLVETISYTYDRLGNMMSTENSVSKHVYTYDKLNRVTSDDNADSNPDTPRVILYYEYDAQGNVIKTRDDAGVTVESTYNSRNQLATRRWYDAIIPAGGIADVADARVDFSYNAAGRENQIRRYSDLAATTKVGSTDTTYDLSGRTDKLIHQDAVDALLSGYDYGYDFSGLLVAEVRDHQDNQYDQTITYGYDLTGQLVDAFFSGQDDEHYEYDLNGNRITSTVGTETRIYSTGPANQLKSDSFYDYEYDSEGNLTFKTRIGDGQVTETFWDNHNRLVKTEERSGGGIITKSVEIEYDTLGNRTTETLNGTIVLRTVLNGQHSWGDYNALGIAETRFLFANETDQILAAFPKTEGTVWYHADKLLTIRGLSNTYGVVGPPIRYSSTGTMLQISGIADWNRFTFTGRELSPIASLLNFRSRFYDSVAGKFTSQDAASFSANDANLYRFVGNSFGQATDPTGETALFEYLFARGTGILNSNNYLRIGLGWNNVIRCLVFRIAIGYAKGPIHWHIDLWKIKC